MNTTKNHLIQKLLLNKKGKKQNGFTLVELMVVIVIVGILTAVGLPELTKSQNKAKSTAAKALVTNASKNCATDLLFEDTPTALPTGVTGTCAATTDPANPETLAATDGGDTWTITLDANGVPGLPVKS
jgi:type IV pilus assembly protein PilA